MSRCSNGDSEIDPTELFSVRASRLSGVLAVEAASARSFGRHTHDQFGIGVLLRGAQDSVSGRGEVRAAVGDMITVNPNEVHDGRPVAGEPRAWSMLYFDPEVIRHFSADLQRSQGGELQYPVFNRGVATRAFFRLYSALIGPLEQSWREVAEQELIDILAPLLGCASFAYGSLLSPAVTLAKARIDEAPEVPVTLAELADQAGLSRYHFLRTFKANTGLPPHAYRLQRQLQRARRLILSKHPLAEVAVAAGFTDQSHLTRHFLRTYGLTPGALATVVRSAR